MRRFLKYTGFTLVLLVVVLIAAVAIVVATESGTHFAWIMARGLLPEGMKIQAVEGRLLGPLTIRRIDYRTRNFHLAVRAGQLRWAPQDLITGRTLDVYLVGVTGVRYTQLRAAPPAPKEKSKPIGLPQRINLPLDARLGALRLRDVEYRPTPDAKPVVLRRAVLSASFVGDRLTVERLAIDAPLLSLNGKARITTGHDYALQGAFDWQARPPHYPPASGRTELGGGLRSKLRLRQTVEAPYATKARVAVSDPLRQLRFDVELNLKDIALQKIDPKLPPTTLDLALKTAGAPDDLALHASAAARDPQYGTLNLAFDGGFADQIVTIEKLAASSPEQPARLRAHGRIALQGKQPAVDVKARWRQLRWPLSGRPQFASREGRLDVDGRINAARAKLFAAVSGTALSKAGISQEQELDANFSGGFIQQTKTLKIDELAVAFADQRLAAQGRVMLAGKQPELDLNSHWQNVRWPLAGKPLITSPAGVVKVNGTQDDLKAELDIGVGDEGHIQGSAKRAGENVDVALNWRKLRWPPTGTPQVDSSQGNLDVNGTIETLRTKLVAALDGPALTGAGIKQEQTLEANFSGGFANKVFNIDKFTLALVEQKTSLTAAGRVALNKKQPAFDLDVGWKSVRWPLAGDAQVESSKGTLKVDGTMAAARARLNAALGGTALVQAGAGQEQKLVMNFTGGFAQQTKLLTIDELALALAQQRLATHGRVSLQGPQPKLDLRTTWRQLRWPLAGEPMMTSPNGDVTVQGTPENLQARLNVGVGEDGSIRGRAHRAGEKIDLALNWRKLRWPLAAPQVASPAGNFTVAGLLKDYQAKLDAQVDAPDRTDAHVSLAGRGSLKSLDLNRIDIEALQGRLTGNAQIAWKPALQASVALDADGINPGELLADWPGKLGMTLQAQARMRDNPVARFETLKVDGRLRGNPLHLDARGAYDPAGIRLDDFSLVSRDSVVEAEGIVGNTVDVIWRIKSPDLGQLLPRAKGKIDGQGSASGPLKRPKIEATLTGAGLRYQTFQLQRLDLDVDVDASGESQSRLSLALENGQAGGVSLNRIALNGEGDPAAHSLSLTARTSTGDADLNLTGTLERPWASDMLWRFQLDEATVKYPQLAAWRLPSPVTGMVDSQRAELSRGCWASGEARLCLQGGRSPQGMHGTVELRDLAFNYFARLLPPDTRLDGKISARGGFDQPENGPVAATMHVGTTAGRVASVVTGIDTGTQEARQAAEPAVASQASTLLNFRPSAVDFAMGEHGMRLVTALRVADAGGIHVEAGVPEGKPSLTERPLRGHITANVPDLSFVAQLTPDVGRFQGRLEGDMRLAGTLKTPDIFGKLALLDSNAVLNGPGLTLNGLRAELTGEGKDGIRLDASARSGGGTLDVGGEIKVAGDDAPRTDIRIHGEDFQVVNTADARVSASPDLAVRTRTGRVNVTGKVRVPHASITPKQLPPSAVSVSSDQVIVEPGDKTQTSEGAGTKVYARVRLILGNDADDLSVGLDENNLTDELNKPPVYIDAFGLNAGFTGELLIVDQPGEPTSGSGELQIVDGTYQAYGQNLIIEQGRILFPGGPISEPGLEVTAIRGDLEDQNVRVGVNVRGSLKHPKFELFSEPSMTQQEQLSYLVLGHASGESSGGESSLLARAALALGLKGGNYLAQNVGSKLGLDEIGIESGPAQGEGEQASLVIGKYLSPKLYVSYGIGLLEPISTLKVQYSITRRLQVVTESSGASSGGDVIYTIERGK